MHPDPPRSTLEQQAGYLILKQDNSRFWEVRDAAGDLVCLTVYRRGAREVVRRLAFTAA
jgi:hypothetical protein